MAASFVGGNIPVLHKCKACQRVLKNAVKLSCGHRVCGDKCLKQLCSNPSDARCPVSSCDEAIIQAEVTVDECIRKAVELAQNEMQVHLNDCGIRTNEKSSELQASNVDVLTESQNSSSFQESFETLRRDLTRLSEVQQQIQCMSRSAMEDMSTLSNDVKQLKDKTRNNHKQLTEDMSTLSNDVKQLEDKTRNNHKQLTMRMVCKGEDAIVQQRRTDGQLQQLELAISKITRQLQEGENRTRTIARQIQDLQDYNRRQQRVIRPVHQPSTAESDLHWVITDYRQKKERNHCEFSKPFLAYGYTMLALIYLNGNGYGKGSHVSVFFALMKSEMNNVLTWPFSRNVKLMILDQTGGGCHHVDTFTPNSRCKDFEKPWELMNKPVGVQRFISHRKIETEQYVRNNTCNLQLVVA